MCAYTAARVLISRENSTRHTKYMLTAQAHATATQYGNREKGNYIKEKKIGYNYFTEVENTAIIIFSWDIIINEKYYTQYHVATIDQIMHQICTEEREGSIWCIQKVTC